MERPTFEMTGGPKPDVEKKDFGEFDWHTFEPEGITRIREEAKTDPQIAKVLEEQEAQMNSIAELAKDAGMEFRGKDDASDVDLLAEEGLIDSDHVEFYKKQEQLRNSPLSLMISWGAEKGVITRKEADDLRAWYAREW